MRLLFGFRRELLSGPAARLLGSTNKAVLSYFNIARSAFDTGTTVLVVSCSKESQLVCS